MAHTTHTTPLSSVWSFADQAFPSSHTVTRGPKPGHTLYTLTHRLSVALLRILLHTFYKQSDSLCMNRKMGKTQKQRVKYSLVSALVFVHIVDLRS